VRDCASFSGLPGNFIRVAIKDVPAMQGLIEAFKEFYLSEKTNRYLSKNEG